MNERSMTPDQMRSARARAMARRRKRQRQRRILLGGMALLVILIVSGIVFGISHYRTQREKRTMIGQAVTAIESGNYSAAITFVDQALEKSDGKVGKLEKNALLYRAEAEYQLQDYDAAIHTYELLEEAGDEDVVPLKANVYNQKAVHEIQEGNGDEALAAIESGLALAGEDTQLIQNLEFNRAVAYEYMQDFQTALNLFEEYVGKYGSDEQVEHEVEFLKTRVSGASTQ